MQGIRQAETVGVQWKELGRKKTARRAEPSGVNDTETPTKLRQKVTAEVTAPPQFLLPPIEPLGSVWTADIVPKPYALFLRR